MISGMIWGMLDKRSVQPFLISNDALADPARLREIMRQHGYLFLKNVAPHEKILELRRDILKLCREAGWLQQTGDDLSARWSGTGPFTEGDQPYMDIYKQIIHLDSFKAVPDDPTLVAIMAKVVNGPVLIHRRKIGRITFPNNAAQTTGAHQDFFYIRGTPDTYTMWMPLGDCPVRLGSLAVLDGSHKKGFIDHVTVPGKKYAGFGLPDERLQIERNDWHAGDFALGDCLIFHSHTVHEALPNLSGDTLRLSIDNRYQLDGSAIEPSSMGTHYNL
jgi:ectoine hydroxylase-related dioxygenase (phytanoyl-CoA dioxygenase family)